MLTDKQQRRRIRCRNSRESLRVVRMLRLQCRFDGTFTGPYFGHKIGVAHGGGVTFIFDSTGKNPA